MNIIVDERLDHGTTGNRADCLSEIGFAQHANARGLDAETVARNKPLQRSRKWAIRFNTCGTVTVILGMKDYGRGWFSAYFAKLVAARLGVPFGKVRIYYSGTLPAVLQTPVPSSTVIPRSYIGPTALAVVELLDELCHEVVEKGRRAFAAMLGIAPTGVDFDNLTGRFLTVDGEHCIDIRDLANKARSASPHR